MLQHQRGRWGAPSRRTPSDTRSPDGGTSDSGAPGDPDEYRHEQDNKEEEEEEEEAEEEEEEDQHHARKRAKSRADSVASYGRRSSVGSPTSSTSDSVTPRRRRPTYLLQKDEREHLVEQVRLMEAQLELLRIKAGVSTLSDAKSIASLDREKLNVEDDIQRNLLQLARLQSLVTRQLHAIPLFPLSSRISLPADHEKRRAIMESVRDLKLRRAAEIVLDRLSTMDPGKPYRHEERRTTPVGLHHWFCFEVQQFRGLRSVKQFFDVMLYMQNNLEISVSEMLGQITLREDTEEDDPTLFNQRIVTTGEVGGTEELNLVGFARWYDAYMPHNGAEFGVIAIDSIKDDALYPYKPLERTCKDVQIAHTVSELRDPDTDELVVVLASATFMTQLPPQFPLPAIVWDKLIENMPRWAIATKQFLRDAVAALAAANADD